MDQSRYEQELYEKRVRGRALAIKAFAVLLFRTAPVHSHFDPWSCAPHPAANDGWTERD